MGNYKTNNSTFASPAEDLFISIFSDVFGPENTKYLAIQYPFVDIYGNSRFLDFVIESVEQKVAIEIDGERYHNPKFVSEEKYTDDLLKQNSLIYNNWKVFRWTYNQVKNKPEQVKDQLKTFLGELPMFIETMQAYLPNQKGSAFTLKGHQAEAVENLINMRKKGETIALLYHATGTGKTVTAVVDAKGVGKRTLFLAHTRELVTQAKEKFEELWEDVSTGLYVAEEKQDSAYVVCGSIQSVVQNLSSFKPEDFGYIIIDEAHHGAADTYKEILKYFKCDFTLGLTATPERADGENILEMFKNVAHKLDLKTAVEIGELVPIRCIRIKTNVDLSSVRINGIKYNAQDLEDKLQVPERDKVILNTYLNYVKERKTVVFCASVKHAEAVAKLFAENGIRAEAVSGRLDANKRKKILSEYENGDIEVLCACDLLNEGWDSPRTEVLFMARPTMSKTIYMQQLGRGTRKSPGKKELIVFDFVDNANMFNMPLSMHRMFDISKYISGEYVMAPLSVKEKENSIWQKGERPEAVLDFPVDVTDYEIVDLFNWQNEAKNMISQLEFVRMVDVQSETIARYIREKLIMADLEVPMGSKTFYYFKEESIKAYSAKFGWEIINASNMRDKFMDMVRTMDMSYSYKPVLLKAMFDHVDAEGKVRVADIVDYFIDFYEDRKSRGLAAEKKKSIYNEETYDRKKILQNIFANPFRRFEDMRFMQKCKDAEYVEFNRNVWRKLTGEEKEWIVKWCDEKLDGYFKE